MNFEKIFLISASIGIGLVGIGYMVSPVFMYGLYEIEISSTNEFNMVRGAYGGMFLSFSILFLIGVFSERITLCSQVALLTFMVGFAVGRTASILLDGVPSPLIFGLLISEVFYTVVSAYFIKSHLKD